ncbi:MAG: hypothetical protein MUO21_03680, partial [Nitrososphaeraceae archaeon]|nr:hypothetical protein [Nitrososphaeraceae archaeon]
MSKFINYQLDTGEINKIELQHNSYSGVNPEEYPGYPGKEHYKLLAHLSTTFSNSTIVDIGTHRGISALALSHNKTNIVHSFDIVAKIDPEMKSISNIIFHIDNLWNITTRNLWKEMILSSSLIFLDIEPHDGIMEYEFYRFLLNNGYRGILIVDDIWYFKGMRDHFWYHVPSEHKLDITKYGHWSGTGLIRFFNFRIKRIYPGIVITERNLPVVEKNWTFVTAYFDLTQCPDASDAIRSRPANFYLEAANTTMGLDVNLVVYCEEKYKDGLERLRPHHLKSKTKYIICQFEDFPLNKYRDKIVENRKIHPSADPRNTPSYYLFCMARYAMIKQTIDENPFESTHFAWCNICIERYGYKNVMALEDVMAQYRDKFSTCYIDYIPKD